MSDVPELPKHVAILEHDGATYYLLGTVHVSKVSAQEAKDLIAHVEPDVVCIELCAARYNALRNEQSWKDLDVFKVIKSGRTLFLLANLAVGAYQRRLGEKLGVRPGAEFLAAAEKAEELGAKVVLVDRDIQTTLKRTWGNLGFWKKAKILGAVFGSLFESNKGEQVDLEELKEQANLSQMLEELSSALPELKEPLIDERDLYMMSGARDSGGKKVVVIVGAAHVPGMKDNIATDVDRDRLDTLPPPSRLARMLKWLMPALFVAAFSYGYFKHKDAAVDMLLAWVIANAAFAALLTAIAGAKLLSIITAAVVSPITSLNPLIPAGIVVGLVEAWLRKPTVADCERINSDVKSLRGIYRNAVTRVLLVAVMATLGSALGAWLGISLVVKIIA